MRDLIDRQAAIDFIDAGHLCNPNELRWSDNDVVNFLKSRPAAQSRYEPVTVEDFAKTMSESALYSFMAWHGEALKLMEGLGFVICKRTM